MRRRIAVCLLLFACAGRRGNAYSVQTHEQLVDLTWKSSIVPLLRARYPNITDAQIAEAHGYAYGGCAIQDIGYYPFGNSLFSDLTHYVRAGDFVASLLRNARTPDELAFAIGALSHYIGDTEGHSMATNPAVAVEFPKLRERYGASVNYEQNPHAHVRTEFGFDINEIAKHRFAPLKYLDHVGLKVSTDLLGRAFYETYGLELKKVLKVQRRTVAGYTFGVRRFLPRIAYAETLLHKKSMPPDVEDAEFLRLQAELKQASVDNGWEQWRHTAGFGTHLLAGFIYIVPKVGVASMLAVKEPDSDTEQLYVRSVNRSTDRLRGAIARLQQPEVLRSVGTTRQTEIPNRDLDTGQIVAPGGYRLTDETYCRLLDTIAKNQGHTVPSGLREDMLAFYANPDAPIATKKHAKQWARVQAELVVLRAMPVVAEP
ncbi:Zinc dependent phospholipase C [Granulicella rosea]|uniref:Zinc dependent phospholipase C n=1 Tax=Granulicella rosea TaxID=474952 RepID=A0A239HN86_9BACT|nr:zinc dependent phospholipase C family protein [Granulicella rosea]SNS82605.1 Zinc dependent phospholipase C [Granulicella rosea]